MLITLLTLGILSAIILFISSRVILSETEKQIFTIENAPSAKVAIVFGAGLRRDGTPTPILRDRVETAVNLYKQGLVSKLLVSGDNRFLDYNEPGAMYDYAISMGVPPEDVIRDYAGRRTYDTCYRAQAIFGVADAILVTQSYHLPRALYLCNHLGITAQGVSSDMRRYTPFAYTSWLTREWVARAGALWDIWIARPLPVLGDPEPIFTDNDSK
ncbi:MAG: YdcF family protein [Anaerolineae bacterium]|nr:YdcF family protein [Anaerolineae bacterium]